MQFTQIPRQYAPLGGELRYAVGQETAGDIDIRIVRAGDGTLLGAKRFASVAEASFDAAPYVRRALQFRPSAGSTGLRTVSDRSVTVRVEAAAAGSEAIDATAPERTFRPGSKAVEAPGMLTTMPLGRLIPEGACDELTFVTAGVHAMTVTAQAGDTTTADRFLVTAEGLYAFRLDTRDYLGAETITVDAGTCGAVVYTVIPHPEGAQRLAWRSSAGSIEHYTFPVVRTTTLRTAKQRAEGPDGRIAAVTSADRETLLVSAYENRAVLEALAELTASAQVWLAEGDDYTPVDVVTDEAVVRRHGSLCCLEIAVRTKTRTPWN